VELIDRYLQAVKFWLPRRLQEDIAAELLEDIQSQMEEQESGLGRKLNEDEVAQLLKQRGRPLLVASRYLPQTQQYLVGPLLFPAYRFVLKVVALGYLLPWLLVWLGFMIFDPAYRAAHSISYDLLSVGGPFWNTIFITIGTVTAVFAFVERVQSRSRFLENWDPRKLRPATDPSRIPRLSSVIEIGINLVFILWWINGWWNRFIFEVSGAKIVLTHQWRAFFWAFLLVAGGNIILSATNLLRPYWTPVRAGLRLLADVAGASAFCWLFKAHVLAEITAPRLSPTDAAALRDIINTNLDKTFPFAVLGCALAIALADLGRLIRLRSRRTRLLQGVALVVLLGMPVLQTGFRYRSSAAGYSQNLPTAAIAWLPYSTVCAISHSLSYGVGNDMGYLLAKCVKHLTKGDGDKEFTCIVNTSRLKTFNARGHVLVGRF